MNRMSWSIPSKEEAEEFTQAYLAAQEAYYEEHMDDRTGGEVGMRDFILRTFTNDEAETCQRCNMKEIVLCKDCKHWVSESGCCGRCEQWHLVGTYCSDWFCADGERKKGR